MSRPCESAAGVRRHTRMRACALVLAATGLLLLGGCGREDSAVSKEPAQRIETVTVEMEPYRKLFTLTGEIEARNEVALSFEVGGRVLDVRVDVGAHVEKGQVLARIDPTEQEADVVAAEASVSAAKAQLNTAKAAFERQKSLLARGFTTRSDYDEAERVLKTAQGSLDAAQAQVSSAQSNLSDTTLRAEAAGVITKRNVDPGQVVGAAQSVFTLAPDGERDAVFLVQEQLLTRKPPQDITIELVSDPQVSVAGYLREVSPLISATTGTVLIKVGLENAPPAMQLGAAVSGTITEELAASVARLPWQALVASEGKPSVWVVDEKDMTVSLRAIEIERYDSSTILVQSGLAVGERVVTRGSQLLRPGETVADVPSDADRDNVAAEAGQ
ncbi:efflux RND transporter periplasmic adaptor subunit [Breoghania sp.]|uniref:efflux RND transporter periplasmic adaptor subunit n=1 Tax=Breoghania sp. TaxID=2065378 RepID=UPI002AA76BA4|nr:efflux RND transporter periplasmic adaptor subunit [Breoghania sp.]